MTIDWTKVKYFNPGERWGSSSVSNDEALTRLNPLLIYSLDALRKFVGRPIIVNNAIRNDRGTHGRGEAADIVITGLHVVDQFLMAERTRLFAGIGLYPHWNTPGLHVDIRQLQPHQHGPRWGRNAAGNYVALDAKFLAECVGK